MAKNLVLKLFICNLRFNLVEVNLDYHYVKRLGKKSANTRPTLVKFNNFRYRLRVLKLNKNLREIDLSVAQNCTKEELKIRK